MSRYIVRQEFGSGLWEVYDTARRQVVGTYIREGDAVVAAYMAGVSTWAVA